MFDQFTIRSQRVIRLAEAAARLFKHNYIGTEHLLLGLIQEGEGVAYQALAPSRVSLAGVRGQIVQVVGEGTDSSPPHIPFAPNVRQVLEHSLDEARRLGRTYVNTEHLLLGLFRYDEGAWIPILENLGVDFEELRERTLALASVS